MDLRIRNFLSKPAQPADGARRLFFRSSIISLVATFAFSAAAAVSEADFDAANKFYGQGKFADAASAYEKLTQSGAASGAIYFNLGDAYFKTGQLGQAIAAYRQAARLTPRDQDVRANLQFVRNQVSGPTLRTHRWQIWIDTLSLNEWSRLTAAAFWAVFLLLALKQLKPQLRQALRTYIIGSFVLFVIFGGVLGVALAQHYGGRIAIVTSDNATARNSPFASQEVFTLHDGAELKVLDQKEDWYQVSDGTGRIGWMQSDSVTVVPSS